MPLRLIEMILPQESGEPAQKLLSEQKVEGVWQETISGGRVLLRILLLAEESEPLIDLLEKQFSGSQEFRLILIPVAGSLPRVEEPEDKEEKPGSRSEFLIAGRVSREELYAQISDGSRLTPVYGIMVILSAIVAAIGLSRNNTAVVIGAMVIAPLLGPNIAMALGSILGDMGLIRKSLKTNGAGLVLALAISVILGTLLTVNPDNPQIVSRTHVGLIDVLLALASGVAGALAFTSGAPATLIGVMVAVALMPPLVAAGLMVGARHWVPGLGGIWLLLTNMICINLAAVTTFWAQGVRPTTWWEENVARRATILSVVSSTALLLALVLILLFARRVL
jgi:uncharacterized hydrophobic protein (TIGR00341 family)